jgi:hypothetical protein
MRYLELLFEGKTYTSESKIDQILDQKDFNWLIDAEIENSKLEIKNNTLIWHEGVFYTGDWIYGIFKNGKFYGNWKNGIFENGKFLGKWNSGINYNQ